MMFENCLFYLANRHKPRYSIQYHIMIKKMSWKTQLVIHKNRNKFSENQLIILALVVLYCVSIYWHIFLIFCPSYLY